MPRSNGIILKSPEHETNLLRFKNTLKQKNSTFEKRLTRYSISYKRKNENFLFVKTEKTFYDKLVQNKDNQIK